METSAFLCVVALREEMEYIHKFLVSRASAGAGISVTYDNSADFDPNEREHHYTIATRQPYKQLRLTCAVAHGMGHLPIAMLTAAYLRDDSYYACFIIGIAGTLDAKKYAPGDVVVAAGSKFLGFDKVSALFGGATARYDLAEAPLRDTELRIRRSKLRNASTDAALQKYVAKLHSAPVPGLAAAQSVSGAMPRFPQVHCGIILGSDWVIDSKSWSEFIVDRNLRYEDDWYRRQSDPSDRDRTDWMNGEIACVDMESYGFFYATYNGGTYANGSRDVSVAISVRGISDPCDDKKAFQDKHGTSFRSVAASNAAAVLVDLMFDINSRAAR